jgi:hypothetical protein
VGTRVVDQLQARAAYWDDAAARYDRNFTGTLIGQPVGIPYGAIWSAPSTRASAFSS